MTLTAWELALYAGSVGILFLTPGPVWVAIIARALSGGFYAALPLALGVVIGDMVWPFVAIIGVAWVVSVFDGFMTVLRYVSVAIFLWMGINLIRNAGRKIGQDSRLTRPGMWAGFFAGVAVILSNPKAILFYMGVLPGFFDLTKINALDIAAIVGVSMVVPLVGNVIFALFVDRMRRFVSTPSALRRMNITSGALLISVGLIIPFT